MDGRFFSCTKVEAYIADGNEKFKKSSSQKVKVDEDDDGDDESKRLDKFGSWLEEEGKETEAS
jgi:HIV Tat-specific factor 1